MPSRSEPAPVAGFTLTEVLIVVAIVAVLVAVGIPSFEKYRQRALVMKAVGDIGLMSVAITNYRLDNASLPASLQDVGFGGRVDPWGRPYEYLDLQAKKGNGQARKDKRLAPLNADFDLYSVGKDGLSQGPLNAKASRDDVVRARDGKFVGLASDFDP